MKIKYYWMKREAQMELIKMMKRGKRGRIRYYWTNETTDKKGWWIEELE